MQYRIAGLLSLLMSSLSLPVSAQTELSQLYSGTAHDAFYGLCVEGDKGTAVGNSGLIVESADGGQNWTAVTAFTERALLDISCGAGTKVIVAQQGGVFLEVDGSYKEIDSGTDARLMSVDGNSDGLTFVVGSFGTVLRSDDGGLNWESLTIDWEAILDDFVEPHLYDVTVSADGVVTAVGEFGLVIRSEDGGETWDDVHIGAASLFGLRLAASGLGYAVGQDSQIIRTEDGGLNWSSVPTPPGGILLNVWFSDSGDVLVSGIRSLLRSTDGGSTWTQVEKGDLVTGWYQGMVVNKRADSTGLTALLAGHQGNVVELNF